MISHLAYVFTLFPQAGMSALVFHPTPDYDIYPSFLDRLKYRLLLLIFSEVAILT